MKIPTFRTFLFIVLAAICIMVPSHTFANFFERTVFQAEGISEPMALLLLGAALLGSATFFRKKQL